MAPLDDLMTIGVFARSTGITPSALRFYADSGVLVPAAIDDTTGYRYYSPTQLDRAVTLRRLREIDVPLDRIVEILDAAPARVSALLDEHVDHLTLRAGQARETATAILEALGRPGGSVPVAMVRGPGFAAAVEQVLAATAHDTEHPALTGVRVESSEDGLVLTATDRYRLSTRTVAPTRPGAAWAGTVDGDDLRLTLGWIRRQPVVELRVDARGLTAVGGSDSRVCRLLPEPFPDHRAVFAALSPVRTRVIAARNALVDAMSGVAGDRLLLTVTPNSLRVSGIGMPVVEVPSSAHGDAVTVAFEVTTLYPAITSTAGPDVMLDVATPDQPVIVRSADDGDLTTLVMPVRHEGAPT
ncbi:MerR family transcriptional regulator [Rhodococcus gannanensis]|uniref:MerR family transcriptional regulator n=1 Tax=Rhodococcus gannanensis TaxID=1960308 RepID=A0ABW4PB87_9NOCA